MGRDDLRFQSTKLSDLSAARPERRFESELIHLTRNVRNHRRLNVTLATEMRCT